MDLRLPQANADLYSDILVENLTARHFATSYYTVGVANWPAYAGYSLCAQARWDGERCPFYGVAMCPLFRRFQCIEVYVYKIWTVTSVCYIVGLPLSGVC